MLLSHQTPVLLIEADLTTAQAVADLVDTLRLPYLLHHVTRLEDAITAMQAQPFGAIIGTHLLEDGTMLDLPAHDIPLIVVADAEPTADAFRDLKRQAYDYLVKDPQGDYLAHLPRIIEAAIRHRRLAHDAQDQRTLAEALRDTALALNSSLKLDEVLAHILDNVYRVVAHDRSLILFLEGEEVTVVKHRGWKVADGQVLDGLRFRVVQSDYLSLMRYTQSPAIANDAGQIGYWGEANGITPPGSFLAAPIQAHDQLIGFIQLESLTPDRFDGLRAEKLGAFAAQAAVAIRNARLFAQAQALAALEERQRIARDLHDSVTQTLFSATVTVDTVIKLWQRNPTDISTELLDLRNLTQGALAEMRTLLLELRPEALAESRLVDLIHQLVETLKGRSKVHPTTELMAVPLTMPLPDAVKETFFRVAQEALNNVVKHARAHNVWVTMYTEANTVRLAIRDDGRGFDIGQSRPGHVGLAIMRERAAAIGGALVIHSAPGRGTHITLTWQPPRERRKENENHA